MPNTKPVGIAYADPQLDSLTVTGDVQIGTSTSTSEKIGFYGATPITQRAAAIQAASVVSASSYITVGSNLAAFAAEVAATMTNLGLWKGSA